MVVGFVIKRLLPAAESLKANGGVRPRRHPLDSPPLNRQS